MWVRVSNAVQDPVTSTALAQDQVVKVVSEEDEWYSIETLEGEKGRLPKVLANAISNPLRTASERVYCSIAAFEGQREGDLAFGIYSILVVETVESEGWLRGIVATDAGKRLGASGAIPVTYVKQLDGFEAPPSTGIPTSFTSDFSTDERFKQVGCSPYARAVYPFVGEFNTELSFQADEIIQILRRVDTDWLEGSVGSRTGIFPQSFVQIVVPLEGETLISESQPSPSVAAQDGIGFAVVRHDFEGREKDELSVKIGDSIRVIRMANNDWVECRDPATDEVGIVPVSFLELYLDEDEDETKLGNSRPASTVDQSFSTLANQSFSAASTVSDWRTSTRLDDSNTTLTNTSFQPNSHNVGWATFGEDWLVPEKKSSPPARPPPPKSSSFESPTDIVSLDDMFKKKTTNNGTNNVIGAKIEGTDKEKRDKVLEELINTELQFITDVNAFTEAVEGSTLLTAKQKAILKSGCAQIVQLAGNLVLGLTTEQGRDYETQAVGSCFLNLRKAFAQTYGYYFRNIEQINQLMTQASLDTRLDQALLDVVKKMQANGAAVIDSTTAVSRPIQRCVKYPLFLSELAKFTPISHSDHPKLLEAVKQMSTLGQKMNESKRRKELSRKYSEDQPSSSLGDMLSKFTIHSIKKKSNRFTYRMGSSLGVVKVTRDVEFDALVNELDACERRLVRFNYTLVIYKKKVFFETRQLIQKKLIDIRKRQVVLSGVDIDREVHPFHNEVKIFAELINSRVRDEIVKALRAIPKKLIKKRNDKLMDWESVKSSNKSIGGQNNKFLDYEALNTQVKQTVPKVIEVLHKVLRDAMDTVRIMDANLMLDLKKIYASAASAEPADAYLSPNRLIVSNIPCFVDFYDPQRLQPLQTIVTKAERKARNHAFIAAGTRHGVEKAAKPKRQSVISVPGTVEEPATINYSSLPTQASEGKMFRWQTEEERKTILDKADLKGRQNDMYRVMADWPATKPSLEENRQTGKMLICKKGDAVLMVQKQQDMNLSVCYNGFYNALLPTAILEPWYNTSMPGMSHSVKIPAIFRPQSTPPKPQQSVNLIDLDDSPIDSVPCLKPNTMGATLVPTKTESSSSTISADTTLVPSAPPASANTTTDDIFDGVRPIDWGAAAAKTSSPWGMTTSGESSLLQKTPSLPNFREASSPAFPVTFDESPTEQAASQAAKPTLAHLPPPMPSSSSNSQSPAGDNFASMWEQIKCQPLSKVTQRSESPLPLIPTRPESHLIPTNGAISARQAPIFDFAQFGAYDTVPTDNTSQLYSNLPAPSAANPFATSPALTPVPVAQALAPAPISSIPALVPAPAYDAPPGELYAQPPSMQYDFPPLDVSATVPAVEDPYKNKASIGAVTALFDFVSQDPNQINLKAGEKLQLLQAHDDFGSPEWILVRPAVGKSGYVPANYCSQP